MISNKCQKTAKILKIIKTFDEDKFNVTRFRDFFLLIFDIKLNFKMIFFAVVVVYQNRTRTWSQILKKTNTPTPETEVINS